MSRRWIALLTAATVLCFATAALAQSRSSQDDDDRARFSMGASLGFLADDPGGVSLGFEAPIEFNRHVSVGPWLTVALADDFLLLSGTANVRYHFDVFEGERLRKLRPFLQGGMGVTYYDDDRTGDEDTGFLLNMGLGAEYETSEHVSVGSQIMFNTVPTFQPSRAFYWTWQFIGVRYRF
ncbi:MAG: porin family protein [Myxococcales bacterium]|nr:porin family protein [Myxococcales bacterium]MDH5306663.1 porin family protein [Myxococcales bacterium]MDH5565262.1 porin family protein [Myxococcales bacterium]